MKKKISTPKKVSIVEFIALRSKAYSFRCNDKNTNFIKGISRSPSKNIKFEEFFRCLFGRQYQKECDNFLNRSLNHEMYLQEVKKSKVSSIDDKLHFESNMESKPWEWNYSYTVRNKIVKFYKNSTGQFSNLLVLAKPNEHSWWSSLSIYSIFSSFKNMDGSSI